MRRGLGLALVLACSSAAFAGDIANFGATKRATFRQADDGSLTPYVFDFATRVIFWTPEAYTGGTVNAPGFPAPLDLQHYTSTGLFTWDGYFNSFEELETKYPAATLTFSLQGGFLPPASESIVMGPSLFSANRPHFTGDTAPRLSAIDPLAVFSGAIAPSTLEAGATIAFGILSIVDLSTGGSAFYQEFQPGETQFEFPIGTIVPGRAYLAIISNENRTQITNAGFNGALGEMIWLQETTMFFNTRGSCPADLNGDGVVDDADFTLFVQAYNVLQCAEGTQIGCPADLTNDGYVLDDDFTVFVVAYNDLLCP
ncbi:MAG: hypothetical protein ACREJD_03205 [Phycisphaerales bacterium]